MMDDPVLQAVVLGILQGLTEFLPISSSAHLLLLPWLLGWQPMGLTFDVILHLGTLLAVVIYFRREWLEVGRDLAASLRGGFNLRPSSRRLVLAILVGTLPALAVGAVAAEVIDKWLRSPVVTVFTLSGFGLLLALADRSGRRTRLLGEVRPRDGLWVGLAQALALMPGVSRSGVTITAALFLGLTRVDSARFSFLLGTPIIALAGAKSLFDLWRLPQQEVVPVPALIVGVVFSFVSGLLCIKYFLSFLKTRSYLPFVVYRLLLAACIFSFLVF